MRERSGMRNVGFWAAVILLLTLAPGGGSGGTPRVLCVLCGSNGGADLILNVVLFLPLGAALGRAGFSSRQSLVLCAVLSASVEAAQLLLPDRAPTLRDIATNALGGGIGAVLWHALPRLLTPGMVSAVSLAFAVSIPTAFVSSTSALLGPAIRSFDHLDVIWAPEFARRGNRWRGTIEDVSIAEIPLPNGPVEMTPALRETISQGAELQIVVRGVPLDDPYMPILRLAPEADESLIIVSHSRDALIVFPRYAATDLRLRSPGVRFPRAIQGARARDPLDIRIHPWAGATPCVTVNETRSCAPPTHVGRGWAFVLPRRGGPQWLLDHLALATLFLPIAFLAPVYGRFGYIASASIAVGAFAAVAARLGFAALGPADLATIALALGAGSLLYRRSALGRTPKSHANLIRNVAAVRPK